MPNKRLIRLQSDCSGPVEWATLDANGTLVDGPHHCTLAQVPHEGNEAIIVLVPSAKVLLTTATVPHTSRSKLKLAIPYALENLLVDNIEQLHFALGEWQGDRIHVAIVKQAEMQRWCDVLKAAGLSPDYLLPDALALPFDTTTWSVFAEERTTLVRTGPQSGFEADASNLTTLLRTALSNKKDTAPTLIQTYPTKQPSLDALGITIETSQKPYFQLAAETLKHPPTLNLLQGPYKAQRKPTGLTRYWRIATILAIAWLAVLFLGSATQIAYLKFQQHRANNKIYALYTTIFPKATNANNPKAAINNELKRLGGLANTGSLLNLFGRAGAIIQKTQHVRIDELTYHNNQINLSLQVDSFQTLATLEKQMKALGLNVKQTQATTKDKAVVAKLTIK